MRIGFVITLLAFLTVGCTHPEEQKRNKASIPMNSKSLRGDQIYEACLKERTLSYCNNVTGRY